MLVRESIKHLTPRSDEEVWKYYLELIEKSGNPIGNPNDWPDQQKSFIKIAKKLEVPVSDLYITDEFGDELNYDDLTEIFKTLSDGEKIEWVRVDFDENLENSESGDWQCFPSMKLAYWISDDMNDPNAWIFSKKFFKTFKINEQYDSPGAKAKFSKAMTPEIIKQMIHPEPYKNLFNYGGYHGKDSGDLNVKINDLMYGKEQDSLGAIEGLYRILVKKIPELKSFKIQENAENKTKHLHLRKEVIIKDEISDTQSKISMDLWIGYHLKNDKIFDYKKGKIKVLYSNSFEAKHFYKDVDPIKGKKIPSFSMGDLNDENEDTDFTKSYQDIPDLEDRNFIEKSKIYHKNLSFNSFLKLIPKIENNIKEFQKYMQEKYEVTF